MNDGAETVVKPHRAGLFASLRNWFLAGIAVTAPIVITVYITWQFVDWVDRNVAQVLPIEARPSTYLPFNIPGLGLILVIVTLTLIGFLTANFIGQRLLEFGETLVARMPVVRGLYGALKQLFETVLSQSGGSYRQVVLVQWPHPRMWTLAFVTTEQTAEMSGLVGEELIGVYVPTTPNPTGGYFVYVPKAEAIALPISVEDGMKIVISTGVVQGPDPKALQRALDKPSRAPAR